MDTDRQTMIVLAMLRLPGDFRMPEISLKCYNKTVTLPQVPRSYLLVVRARPVVPLTSGPITKRGKGMVVSRTNRILSFSQLIHFAVRTKLVSRNRLTAAGEVDRHRFAER